jgi:hypothetical protein
MKEGERERGAESGERRAGSAESGIRNQGSEIKKLKTENGIQESET